MLMKLLTPLKITFLYSWNYKKGINYSQKHFRGYLSNESISTIFLQPTDKEETANIISSRNSNKASSPNSIPYRILLLQKNEISKQMVDLCNLSQWNIKANSRFIQPPFHGSCYSLCTQNFKSSSCFSKRLYIKL